MPAYRFQRGEDARLLLAIVGDASEAANVAAVAAVLKPAVNDGFVPSAATPAAATFAVVPNLAPTDGSAAGWNLTLAAAQTAQLDPGTYVTNAELTYEGGSIEITEPLFVTIQQSTAA